MDGFATRFGKIVYYLRRYAPRVHADSRTGRSTWGLGDLALRYRSKVLSGARPAVLFGVWRSAGTPTGMILSFGFLILRKLLQLIVLGMRGERVKEIEILVLRH